MRPTRDTFRRLLVDATESLAAEQGKSILFAAPLAVRLLNLLKTELGPDDVEDLEAKTGLKPLKLAGPVFGETLYPDLPPDLRNTFKFRQFLEAFPDVVEVLKTPSGDMVRVLNRALSSDEELKKHYHQSLLATLSKLLRIRGTDTIPANQLAIQLKRRIPSFDVGKIARSSFTDWLKTIPEIRLEDADGVVRVGAKGDITFASTGHNTRDAVSVPASVAPKNVPRPAYFLVDGSDLHSVLHSVLGAKPTQAELPDWGRCLAYFRARWPQFDWRARYFMALTPDDRRDLQGFCKYLEAVGLKVIGINLDPAGLDFDQVRQERIVTTLKGIDRALNFIRDESEAGVVLVASHSAGLVETLKTLLSNRSSCLTGLVGFKEKAPDELRAMESRGLVLIDLEHDCRAFKNPLNRRQGYDLEGLSADAIL